MQDLDAEFERAQERGVLEATVEEVVADDDYLEQHGVDAEAVATAEERATERPTHNKSQKEIVLDAVREQDQPDREDVRAYAEQFGMNSEKALKMLDKFRENGDVGGNYDGPFRVY